MQNNFIKIIKVLLIFTEMVIFACGAVVIGWVIFPVLSLFLQGSQKRRAFARIIRKSWAFFIWMLEVSGLVKANNVEQLPKIQNKIIAASHPGFLDIVFLIGLIPNSLCLAKKQLLKNPFMRNIVKSLYIINDISPDEFKKSAKEALAEGYNIIIFPTGTRTLPNEKIKIHKGAAQLAIDNNINIVPVKILTDFPFFAKNSSPFNVSDKIVNYYFEIQPEIKISEFKQSEPDEIKLRKRISDKIKISLN